MVSLQRARLRAFKYQALGNSYIVLDPRDTEEAPSCLIKRTDGSMRPSRDLVRWLCNPYRGIGSNGLLFGPIEVLKPNRFGLCIINSDGTYSGFSGNGIRIFVRYLLDQGYICWDTPLIVRTWFDEAMSTRIEIPVQTSGNKDDRIRVRLPYPPRFGPDAIGTDLRSISALQDAGKGLSFTVHALAVIGESLTGVKASWGNSTFVDIGNPHCVTFVRDGAHLPSRQQLLARDGVLRQISFCPDPEVDAAPTFAHGANLQWVRVCNRSSIDLVVYERGEGPTEASGSSASAAACAAFARGLVGPDITVNMSGGSLLIKILAHGDRIVSVTLSGFAARIFEAHVDVPPCRGARE